MAGRSRPSKRPENAAIFVGCEGDSEHAYVALLSRLLQTMGDGPASRISLKPQRLNPGAGDPYQLVSKAVQKASSGGYSAKAIFLDADRLESQPEIGQRALSLAASKGFMLVRQLPMFEAFLLRHLDGCGTMYPSPDRAVAELEKRWPGYRKGMSADELRKRIDWSAIQRACAVTTELELFLRRIGLKSYLKNEGI